MVINKKYAYATVVDLECKQNVYKMLTNLGYITFYTQNIKYNLNMLALT